MYLFDASSIVNLIKHGITRIFKEGITLDLARYETLNAVWKEYKLLRRMEWETALELIKILSQIFETIGTESIRGSEEKVLELAMKENLTIYDAVYLFTAINRNLILVTDDKKLGEKASIYVRTLTTRELIRKAIEK